MTRREAREEVIRLFERGVKIEAEWSYLDKQDGKVKKCRLLSGNTGYKWKVIYTLNDKGVFTASDVQLYDAWTESQNYTDHKGIRNEVTGRMVEVF